MRIERPDAIVVGSGAGGGSAAHVLTQRGWNVVLMEKGDYMTSDDFLPLDELHFREHKALMPSPKDDPNVYVDANGNERTVERWWVSNVVGGSTMVWDANFPRYTKEDFRVLDYLRDVPSDASMVNWPWTYEEWHPYFEQMETDWCVSGQARQCDSQEPLRDGYEYAMPPLKRHASTDFLMQAFGKAGMTPYLGPRAINSETFDSRPACSFCGFCQFFGCAVNSRASSVNTVLAKARSTGLCDLRTRHCVTRLVHENGQIRGVMYKTDPAGPEQFLEAPLVFVSIQTIESARLFLISEIPDPNKMIGRYLAYHTKGNCELTFKNQPVWDMGPAYQPRTAVGSLQLRDLYVIDDSNTYLTKGGKFSIYDPLTVISPIRLMKAASLSRTDMSVWGKQLVQYMQELRSQGGVYFSFTGEALSVYDNRVELHPTMKDPWGMPVAKTYYQHHQYDCDLSSYALERITQVMVDAGGELRKFDPQAKENPGYGHVHGTLRAGKDPGASVLDEMCQSHTVKGLYVLDNAWMPTAGASNPSPTLIANAYRVCSTAPRVS